MKIINSEPLAVHNINDGFMLGIENTTESKYIIMKTT